MLTERQRDVLDAIRAHQSETGGVSPSVRDIAARLNLRSKSLHTVHRMLLALEERGFIRRLHGRARAIEVLDRTPMKNMRAAWFKFDDEVKELVPLKRGLN